MRSRDKLNTLYLHLQKTYQHQIRQGGDLLWEAPILKFTRPFNRVNNLKSLDKIITSLSKYLLATKLSRVLTSGRRLRPKKPKWSLTSCTQNICSKEECLFNSFFPFQCNIKIETWCFHSYFHMFSVHIHIQNPVKHLKWNFLWK